MEWLVADDSELSMDMAVEILKDLGEGATGVLSGEEALAFLQSPEGEKIEAVLLDYRMPGMSGAETAARIREKRRRPDEGNNNDRTFNQSLLIIGMSGDTDEETIRILKDAGMDEVIGKPLEISRLREIIVTYRRRDTNTGDPGGKRASGVSDAMTEASAASLTVSPTEKDFPWDYGLFDRETGIRYSGSDRLLYKYLGNFVLSHAKIRNRIVTCYEEGNIRDFTIEVHALKSTARMLGNLSLSARAKTLEEYGDAGRKEDIDKEMPQFLEELEAAVREAKKILKDYADFSGTADDFPEGTEGAGQEYQTEASQETVAEILCALQEAAGSYDLDSADRCMEDLLRLKLSKELAEEVKELEELVAEVDFAGIGNKAGEMLSGIRGCGHTDFDQK